MTKERLGGQEVSEISPFSPEYWDGHSTTDNCEWKPNVPRIPFWTAIREESARWKAQVETSKILLDYLRTQGREPIKTYNKGDRFIGEEFPEGTIVRFEREYIHQVKQDNPNYHKIIYWGVLINEGDKINKLVLICFSDKFIVRKNNQVRIMGINFGLTNESVINVGEVEHSKNLARFGFSQDQWIERVNWLEIMGYGRGIRRQVKEKAKVPILGRLFPSPLRS